MTRITDLPELVACLPAAQRARFERIFDVQLVQGECLIPDTMREWTVRRFGSVDDVQRQQIVRVTNSVTWEGAIFNPLRIKRPVLFHPGASPSGVVDVKIPDDDVFADPLRTTAADVFGRVRGQHCITTSNVARWDGQCSVLIFAEPDPFAFSRDHLRDYFRTALAWADRAHAADPEARHLVWMWNGGTAGGASIPHAHAQMGLGRYTPYAFVEGLRRAALRYRAEQGANYFDDLVAAHDDVGLGFALHGLRGFVNLAASRPKDTWIVGPAFDETLADALHDALRALIDRAGVRGFDVGVVMPPLYPAAQKPADHPEPVEGDRLVSERSLWRRPSWSTENWAGFPVIARIVDRGRPDAVSSDLGAMDFFAQRVIADDPFTTRAVLES
jgi:hypothetical protein